jgi:acetoacetyl-CoA synthetase
MVPSPAETPVWVPSPERVARARLTAFIGFLHESGAASSREVRDYATLHAWSVRRRELFWPAVWRFCGIQAEPRVGAAPWDSVGTGLDRMAPPDPTLGPRWFPGARLNFAENLLRHDDDAPALIGAREGGVTRRWSHRELRRDVARAAAALQHHIQPGDRVAAYVPNIPEAAIVALAAASLGAVWSSCSPDFGVPAVVDRFGQVGPRVLLTVDGCRYAGKVIDLRPHAAELASQLPSVERVVVVPYLGEAHGPERPLRAVAWPEWLGPEDASGRFTRLPFDHPLYILFSSGTTGLPKCMVHGAGGTLLQHQKEHVLHCDLGPGDRLFYYTTTGWMMWNWLLSALATGAAIVLYDGAPLAPDPRILWDLVEREQVTVFGTSAKYLALAEKIGLEPRRTHDLGALRSLLSTGSVLAEHSYDYVYRHIKTDLHLANISGGTELISCFALGIPTEPVWRGELQGGGLGMAVDVYDDAARSTRGPGELVCTKPFPSMPQAFWNDADGAKYRAAYFDRFPGVWRHGDWAERTVHGGLIIHGRSDATLNPGGIRIGTAEIYRLVERLPEVLESLAIVQARAGEERIVLFVRLREGLHLDPALHERICRVIREGASPHHVPQRVVQAADLPRTISGKVSELAVRAAVHGEPVKNIGALANPEALDLFRNRLELQD